MNKDAAPIPNPEIIIGGIYEHCHHRKYQVERTVLAILTEVIGESETGWEWDATGYEITGNVRKVRVTEVSNFAYPEDAKKIVIYTQLEAGSFPAGTKWVRLEDDFKGQTVMDDNISVDTFKLVK